MLIADELMLLVLDDDTGKLASDGMTPIEPVLAGAMLVDLALVGFVDVAGADEDVKVGRVIIRKPGPTTDPLLDQSLAKATADEGKQPVRLISTLGKGLQAQILERLVTMGAIRAEKSKILGIFPRSRWPEADPHIEAEVRERLSRVLFHGQAPDERTACTISLLLTANVLTKAFRTDPSGADVDKKALTARAKEVADSDWASGAARKAVQELQAAMVIATMIPVMTATTI
jgi:hypothetical protein